MIDGDVVGTPAAYIRNAENGIVTDEMLFDAVASMYSAQAEANRQSEKADSKLERKVAGTLSDGLYRIWSELLHKVAGGPVGLACSRGKHWYQVYELAGHEFFEPVKAKSARQRIADGSMQGLALDIPRQPQNRPAREVTIAFAERVRNLVASGRYAYVCDEDIVVRFKNHDDDYESFVEFNALTWDGEPYFYFD